MNRHKIMATRCLLVSPVPARELWLPQPGRTRHGSEPGTQEGWVHQGMLSGPGALRAGVVATGPRKVAGQGPGPLPKVVPHKHPRNKGPGVGAKIAHSLALPGGQRADEPERKDTCPSSVWAVEGLGLGLDPPLRGGAQALSR